MKLQLFLDRFLPQPSFIEGMARILDFTNDLPGIDYFRRPNQEVDAAAIYSDWVAVGNDLSIAYEQFEETEAGGRIGAIESE